MIVDQCLPDFASHDAIGSHVLQVRRALTEAGYESEIWADRIDERLSGVARTYRDYPSGRGGALVYQMSTDSEMVPWLRERAAAGVRLALNYHNITPSQFFRRWEPRIADRLDLARTQLERLAGCTELGVAVSHFNESELIGAGYSRTVVAPLLVDLAGLRRDPDAKLAAKLRREAGARWLFVGRLAPNKCQHDVVAAFAVYRRLYDPAARLALVGSPSSYRYQRAVERLASDLGVGDAIEYASGLAGPQLGAYYGAADVFVCLSEHEGFCVPLLESMSVGLPVVAYDAGAVAETLGDAGVLLRSKDPLEVAVRVHELLGDGQRRRQVADGGTIRAENYSLEATTAQFLEVVAGWLGERAPTGR